MKLLLSPAKKQDFYFDYSAVMCSQRRFAAQSEQLVKVLRQYNHQDLASLMHISGDLAELNSKRYQDFAFNGSSAATLAPAVLAFQGDVYRGLQAAEMNAAQQQTLQQQVRILSGLYGVLRPFDLIQPYRLEMKTKLATDQGKHLYAFWGAMLAEILNEDLQDESDPVVINLASQEYFKAIDLAVLNARVIHVDFKVDKGNGPKIIGIYAKRARGLMARYAVLQNVKDPQHLQSFDLDGYVFAVKESDDSRFVFIKQL
jgi:uncharacterized protein